MPWIAFTSADIASRISTREMQIYQSNAVMEYPEGGGEPAAPDSPIERLPIIAEQILARFRGAVRANPNVTYIGPEGTLPDFCIAEAAIIGRVAAIGLNPVAEGMTDPRRDEYRAAVDFLKSIPTMNARAFDQADELPGESSASATYGGSTLLDF